MSRNNHSKNKTPNFSKGGDSKSKFADMEAVVAQPLQVRVYGNNFDKALKAFRALVQKERILSLYKEKQRYEKKSDKRRRKKNEAQRKLFEASFEKKSFKKQDNLE